MALGTGGLLSVIVTTETILGIFLTTAATTPNFNVEAQADMVW